MPPYSSGGGDLLSPPCTQPTHLYQSRDHSCTHNWDFHIQFAKSPPRTVGNIFIWRVQYGEEDKDGDFVWKMHSAARYVLQQWNSSLPWSLLVSQYNEATFFFSWWTRLEPLHSPVFLISAYHVIVCVRERATWAEAQQPNTMRLCAKKINCVMAVSLDTYCTHLDGKCATLKRLCFSLKKKKTMLMAGWLFAEPPTALRSFYHTNFSVIGSLISDRGRSKLASHFQLVIAFFSLSPDEMKLSIADIIGSG